MFRRLLVPVDVFAEEYELVHQAVRAASPLLTPGTSELLAVNVLTPRGAGISTQEFPSRLDYLRGLAKAALESLTLDAPSTLKLRSHVMPSGEESTRAAVRTVLDCATEKSCDVVALGTHGRSGIDRFFLGSFAESLLQQATLPVLTVNEECKTDIPYKRILFPVDDTTINGRQWIYAATLSRFLALPITLLYHHRPMVTVVPFPYPATIPTAELDAKDAETRVSGLKARMQEAGVKAELEFIAAGGRTADHIVERAANVNGTLVLMLTHLGQKGRLGVGSVTRHVIRRATCPVLSVPRGRET